jgi:hypothetical protein
MVAAWIARRALASPAWRLAWDGGSWRLQAPGREDRVGSVVLMLDLGAWVLVRFSPQSSTRPWQGAVWLPLSRRSTAGAWPALRVALYAPQPVRPAA